MAPIVTGQYIDNFGQLMTLIQNPGTTFTVARDATTGIDYHVSISTLFNGVQQNVIARLTPSDAGEYSSGSTYVANQSVHFTGAPNSGVYIAGANVAAGVAPPASPWVLLSKDGINGSNGNTISYGTTAPSITGNPNDLYINSSNGNIYRWTTSWQQIGNIYGTTGTAGISAIATTSSFTQPAVNANVTVTVNSSAGFVDKQPLFHNLGGYYIVSGTPPSATTVTLKNLGYAGNIAAAASVGVGTLVPSGLKGVDAGGSGHTILEETSPVPQRSKLAFQGAGVTATDDAANDQTIITISGAAGGFALRELLTAARTYYVRTDGNDTNNGLIDNAAGAFLTLDRAILAVASLDLGVISPKIKLADGTYSGSTLFRTLIGAGKVLIEGNLTTPANVILTTTTGDVLYSSSGFVGVYQLKGVIINAPNNAIYINGGGVLEFGKCVLGSCGSVQLATQNGSKISIIDNYSITGDAFYHVYAIGSGATIFYNVAPANPVTVTLSGSRNFSGAFGIASALGILEFDGPSYCTFTGAATGLRYICNENALIKVGGAGATYLPGGTNGTPTSGGFYG